MRVMGQHVLRSAQIKIYLQEREFGTITLSQVTQYKHQHYNCTTFVWSCSGKRPMQQLSRTTGQEKSLVDNCALFKEKFTNLLKYALLSHHSVLTIPSLLRINKEPPLYSCLCTIVLKPDSILHIHVLIYRHF